MAAKIALPHYGSPDDVEKVASYLAGKPAGASEAELLRQLGTRCADPRKFELYDRLGLFRRDNGLFRLSPAGKRYVEGNGRKKRAIIQEALRGFRPYHEVLVWAQADAVAVLEADRVKQEWAQHFAGELDLDNAYRTSAAPMTFFGVCEMAGLGSFVVGRRGAKSRLEFDAAKLNRYVHGEEEPESVADTEEKAPATRVLTERGASEKTAVWAADKTGDKTADKSAASPAAAEAGDGDSAAVATGIGPAAERVEGWADGQGMGATGAEVEPASEPARESAFPLAAEGPPEQVPAHAPARGQAYPPAQAAPRHDPLDPPAFTIAVPIYGKIARLTWVRPTMTVTEWEKFKKVGDAMFLDE